MYKKLNWQAYSSGNRNELIEAIKDVISKSDGYIMNFNLFSDIALSLSIEIEEQKVAALHEALSGVVTVSELDQEKLHPHSSKEVLLFLNVSFSSGKGDVAIEIPAVPG